MRFQKHLANSLRCQDERRGYVKLSPHTLVIRKTFGVTQVGAAKEGVMGGREVLSLPAS